MHTLVDLTMRPAIIVFLGVLLGAAGCAAPQKTPEPAARPAPEPAPGPAAPSPAAPSAAAASDTEAPPRQAEAGREREAEAGPQGQLSGILAAHNRYRERHCAPPLEWSEELARAAQDWANRLRDQRCAFQHNPDTPHGENLAFYSPPGSTDPARVVAGWYSEVDKYDFRNPGFDMATGHFTQVVWAGTRELGCGVARCANAELWVCNYSPPGNFNRQYRSNVRPATCKQR